MPLDNLNQNLRVLVADDHPVFREGLRMLLETDPKIRVVGEARDGTEAAAMASELKPHLVLMDWRMPRCSGLEALKLFQKLSLPIRILILATEVRKMEIVEALRYGASGVVLKETATQLLRKSISTVMAGQYWIEREGISEADYEGVKSARPVTSEVSKKSWRLTPREEQIVAEVVSGKTNNEIAQSLGMSAQTVKHHLTSIFDKVGVYNRLELALFCVNNSVVNDEELQDVEPGAIAFNSSRDSSELPAAKSNEPSPLSRTERDLREKTPRPSSQSSSASPSPNGFPGRKIR